MSDRWTHFLHVPKTGGSAIGSALAPLASTLRIAIHGHATRLSDVPPGEDVFFFLRHPVERYVSGFNSRFRRGRPLRELTWTAAEERAFATFQSPSALAEALGSADAKLATEARFSMRNINHVSTSFTDWFTIEALVSRRDRIVLLGLQSHLGTDFEFLKRRLGIHGDVHLPADPVLAHRTPPEYETTLSPTAHRNITTWYRDDITFFARYEQLRREWFGRGRAERLRGDPASAEYSKLTIHRDDDMEQSEDT